MKLYICGDSFAVPDPEYGACWVDQLELPAEIVNLARVGASNLLISLQVDQALQHADAVIYLATAATRTEMRVAPGTGQLLQQFQNQSLTAISLHSIDHTTCLTDAQIAVARSYHKEFGDLDLDIYRSHCTIQSTLYRLQKSGVPFVFDQGGFEHASYSDHTYFEEFDAYRSKINLWDYTQRRPFRPYYHITDPDVHVMVTNYYTDVCLNLLKNAKT
jgi:hypothetical protein